MIRRLNHHAARWLSGLLLLLGGLLGYAATKGKNTTRADYSTSSLSASHE